MLGLFDFYIYKKSEKKIITKNQKIDEFRFKSVQNRSFSAKNHAKTPFSAKKHPQTTPKTVFSTHKSRKRRNFDLGDHKKTGAAD
jgi:hypothetical protein